MNVLGGEFKFENITTEPCCIKLTICGNFAIDIYYHSNAVLQTIKLEDLVIQVVTTLSLSLFRNLSLFRVTLTKIHGIKHSQLIFG